MTEEIQSPPKKDEPKGVGGWLAIFGFAMLLLGPSRTMESLNNMWDRLKPGSVFPVVRQYGMVVTAVSVALMIYGMVVGFVILRRSRHGRTVARQYLVIRIITTLAFGILTVTWIYTSFAAAGAKRVAVGMIPGAALEIGVCLLWWCYFTYSKRVRNTYCAREGI